MQAMEVPSLRKEVPNDLVLAILSKLPVKVIVRFRCLSRSLAAATASPVFTASYHLSRPRALVFNLHQFIDVEFTALSAELRPIQKIIVAVFGYFAFLRVDGPCDGLFCFSNGPAERIAIWNPSTREIKRIPPSTIPRPLQTTANCKGKVCLGFDSGHEYKVVRFVDNHLTKYPNNLSLEVYSLSSDSWYAIPAPGFISLEGHSFWDSKNGLYHWSAWAKPCTFGDNSMNLISFDMKESLTVATMPNNILPLFVRPSGSTTFRPSWDFLRHSDGAMALIVQGDTAATLFHLWVKREEGWLLETTIGPYHGLERPLSFWKNDQLILKNEAHQLFLQPDLGNTGVVENLGIEGRGVMVYAESLVGFNGRNEQQEGITREMVNALQIT